MQLDGEYLTELASFVRVVEEGTFAGAARSEGVPKSTITRRIARLEEHLGVELLKRAPRSFTVSDDGRVLYERSVGALRELGAATRSIRELSEEPMGTLVITGPPDLGHMPPFVDLLVAARERYPNLQLEVRLEQRLVDLIREDVDLAIRPMPPDSTMRDEEGLMSRKLVELAGSLFASEDYVRRHGMPSGPNLRDHDVIGHVAFRRRELRLQHSDGRIGSLQTEDFPIIVNDFDLIRSMVVRGMGIGLLWDEVGAAEPNLVRLLPGWSAVSGELRLVWAATRHLSPRVRAFVELAVEVFGPCPSPSH